MFLTHKGKNSKSGKTILPILTSPRRLGHCSPELSKAPRGVAKFRLTNSRSEVGVLTPYISEKMVPRLGAS